jgi:hypothetical protein
MNKTVSLETAKKLINVRIRLKTESGYHTNENFTGIRSTLDDDYIPAPDIPELLAELPIFADEDEDYKLRITKCKDGYQVSYIDYNGRIYQGRDGSEDWYFYHEELVEALAQALIKSKAEVKNER